LKKDFIQKLKTLLPLDLRKSNKKYLSLLHWYGNWT